MNQEVVGQIQKVQKNRHDFDVMMELSKSVYMNVRREVAMVSQHEKILNRLAYDPVLNVSYKAASNSRCTIKREFNNIGPCVLCNLDSLNLNCNQCENHQKQRF